jgi:hypothetical protein
MYIYIYIYIHVYVQINIRINMWIPYHTVLLHFCVWYNSLDRLGFEGTVVLGLPQRHFEFGSLLDAETAFSITVLFSEVNV